MAYDAPLQDSTIFHGLVNLYSSFLTRPLLAIERVAQQAKTISLGK
jgi:hypothetical protein